MADLDVVVVGAISLGVHGLEELVHGHDWHVGAGLIPVLVRAAHLWQETVNGTGFIHNNKGLGVNSTWIS